MKNRELIHQAIKSLEEALRCVAHMTSKMPVNSVIYVIRQMLKKLRGGCRLWRVTANLYQLLSHITFVRPEEMNRRFGYSLIIFR